MDVTQQFALQWIKSFLESGGAKDNRDTYGNSPWNKFGRSTGLRHKNRRRIPEILGGDKVSIGRLLNDVLNTERSTLEMTRRKPVMAFDPNRKRPDFALGCEIRLHLYLQLLRCKQVHKTKPTASMTVFATPTLHSSHLHQPKPSIQIHIIEQFPKHGITRSETQYSQHLLSQS